METEKSAAKVARDLGLAPATYRAYERGENKAPIDVANKIAKYFNKTLEEMFSGIIQSEVLEPRHVPPTGDRDLPVFGTPHRSGDGFDLDTNATPNSYIERPPMLKDIAGA